jgi:outer membrane protein assembly factor BamD (BamD/ComL family)
MKSYKFLLLRLMIVVSLFLSGCATEKSFWNQTVKKDMLQAYDEYLAKYPKGQYVSQAQSAKQRLIERGEFNQVMALNNEDAYRDFLKKYPNSRYTREVRNRLGELEDAVWKKAGNSVEALDNYLKRFPQGRYAREAETKKSQIREYQAWEKAKRADNLESYDQYLRLYPYGRYTSQAGEAQQRLIEKNEFDQAVAQGNEDALRDFLKKYPNSAFAREARNKLVEFEKKEFDRACVKNTEEAFGAFLKKYPRGTYASEARNKLAELEKTVWKQAEAQNSVEALDNYLKRFPQGKYVKEAGIKRSQLLEQKAWEKASQANNFESYGEYVKSYPKGVHVKEARKEIAKSYLLNDAEVAKVAKLQQEDRNEAKRAEYIDKLIFTGANCLDQAANWVDRVKGRKIYEMLKKYDSQVLTDSMIRVVLIQIDRLKVLFLVVKLGVTGTQKPLNALLIEYGDKSMAEDYLNSGSKELYDGGATWARAHGYSILTGWGSHRVSWGTF